jgi:GNAT superfamily N-acetyltransferase
MVGEVEATYSLRAEPPATSDYVALRAAAGLSIRTPEQAEKALAGSWAACHVTDQDGVTVGMGRVVGDGGWYFLIADMAVHPDHQRRGIGDAILTWLLAQIRDQAPSGAYVTLMADRAGAPAGRGSRR